MVMACRFNASVAVGSDLDVRGVSCLACQREFGDEENAAGMGARLRLSERLWLNSSLDSYLRVWLQCFGP